MNLSDPEDVLYTPEGINDKYTSEGISESTFDMLVRLTDKIPATDATSKVGRATYKVDHPECLLRPPRYINQFSKIKRDLHSLRWHSGLEQYPYTDGLEGLRTTLICVINTLSEQAHMLEELYEHAARGSTEVRQET